MTEGNVTIGGPIIDSECRLSLVLHSPVDSSRRKRLTAIVDTGATATAISPQIAAELGLPVIGQALAHAAGGIRQCNRVVGVVTIGPQHRPFTKMIPMLVAAEMTNDMLFGMDLMEGGVLTVDLVRGEWEWRAQAFG